jgi:hypothetical protein
MGVGILAMTYHSPMNLSRSTLPAIGSGGMGGVDWHADNDRPTVSQRVLHIRHIGNAPLPRLDAPLVEQNSGPTVPVDSAQRAFAPRRVAFGQRNRNQGKANTKNTAPAEMVTYCLPSTA